MIKKEVLESQVKALKRENSLLRFALDQIHEGIIITDRDDRIVLYNVCAEETEGMSRRDMLGRKEEEAYGFIPGYDFDQLFTKKVKAEGKPMLNVYHEYSLPHGNKTAIIFDVRPYYEDHEVAAVCTIGRNVNQIKDFIVDTLETNQKNSDAAKNTNGAKYYFDDIIGESAPMKELIGKAKQFAKRESPILLYGETGTGKELMASSIHNRSLFAAGPFVAVNCAAIPETLLESILFGVSKGSYTGAVEGPGLFEQANGGTLFLDEINSMPLSLQPKLLRAIQEKSVRRVGGNQEIPIHCRIISAVNQDPRTVLGTGVIRDDLFFRLATIELKIPPLRERKEDIEYLVWTFIRKYNIKFGLFVEEISPELMDILNRYDWPGNIRELENMVESSLNLVTPRERTLKARHLSDYFSERFARIHRGQPFASREQLQQQLQNYEKSLYEKVLKDHAYNIPAIAKEFGVSRQSVYGHLRKLGIDITRKDL
ncbi:MAG TPA: sigma 54-interacting transcriptional regulator [Clostridiales bacterium]|nr:sigma 54-interacting transcriptional regulator [Clostridiales bacterium]